MDLANVCRTCLMESNIEMKSIYLTTSIFMDDTKSVDSLNLNVISRDNGITIEDMLADCSGTLVITFLLIDILHILFS